MSDSAEVSGLLFDTWSTARDRAAEWQAVADTAEKQLREQAGNAKYLTVGGVKVAVRITQEVTGASWTKDFYRRTARKGTGNASC